MLSNPELEEPYQVALVDLGDGVRMLANIVNGAVEMGDRVSVRWSERNNAPPLPVFERKVE